MRTTTIILTLLIILNLGFSSVCANQIDIGIFTSQSVTNQIDVKIRPDFNIQSNQTVTGILYTVRWSDPSISIASQYIFPFFVAPQGTPLLYNDYYYQVFAAVPLLSIQMNAGDEYIVSSFTYTNGECSVFEIIEDEWTQSHNGNVYLELVGQDVSGSIYQTSVIFGSFGGGISGNDTIMLGNTTGIMTLSNQNGEVLTWQRKVNEGTWTNIPGSAGILTFIEIPSTMGDYSYRALVQNGTCEAKFSEELTIVVTLNVQFNLKVFLEGPFINSEMSTVLNNLDMIPLSQPYSPPPWNYPGIETLDIIPDNMVDWVLVELRESSGNASTATPDKTIGKIAALLMKEGSIKNLDGIENLQILLSLHSNLYIVINHRNHLPIISSVSPSIISGNVYYNFSIAESQVLGGNSGHKEIAPGIWGMNGGDGNADGFIDNLDKNISWYPRAGTSGYVGSDFNLDGRTDNSDKNNIWINNINSESQVPN